MCICLVALKQRRKCLEVKPADHTTLAMIELRHVTTSDFENDQLRTSWKHVIVAWTVYTWIVDYKGITMSTGTTPSCIYPPTALTLTHVSTTTALSLHHG